jgi:hypothetical protein
MGLEQVNKAKKIWNIPQSYPLIFWHQLHQSGTFGTVSNLRLAEDCDTMGGISYLQLLFRVFFL